MSVCSVVYVRPYYAQSACKLGLNLTFLTTGYFGLPVPLEYVIRSRRLLQEKYTFFNLQQLLYFIKMLGKMWASTFRISYAPSDQKTVIL